MAVFRRRNLQKGKRWTKRSAKTGWLSRSSKSSNRRFSRGKSKLSRMARELNVPRPLTSPFPNYKLCRHKYVEKITIPAASLGGGSRYYSFRSNSMYDPNFTGVGHQPLYRDEIAAQYGRYIVIASYFKIIIPNESAQQQIWWCFMDEETTPPSSSETLLERYRYHNTLKLDKRTQPLVLRASFDAKKEYKSTLKGLMSDDVHRTAVGSNPANMVTRYFHVGSSPLQTTPSLSAIDAIVDVTYVTMWMEPVNPLGS